MNVSQTYIDATNKKLVSQTCIYGADYATAFASSNSAKWKWWPSCCVDSSLYDVLTCVTRLVSTCFNTFNDVIYALSHHKLQCYAQLVQHVTYCVWHIYAHMIYYTLTHSMLCFFTNFNFYKHTVHRDDKFWLNLKKLSNPIKSKGMPQFNPIWRNRAPNLTQHACSIRFKFNSKWLISSNHNSKLDDKKSNIIK